MSIMTQLQIAFELWKDWLRETFGSGVMFPTEHLAPGFRAGYTK
jgi:hypothetical protein